MAKILIFFSVFGTCVVAFPGVFSPVKDRAVRSDDVSSLEGVQQQQAKEMGQLKAQLAAVQTKIAQLSTPLVFTGEGGSGKTYSDGATVHFDRVLSNVGGMYNKLSGVVTVPHDGVYLIYFRSDPPGSPTDSLALDLKVNNVHQTYAYGEHGTTGGATLALRLKGGDRVHVLKDSGVGQLGYATVLSYVRASM